MVLADGADFHRVGEDEMRFLVAEDDEALRTYLGRGLEADGHQVCLAGDGQAAVDAFMEDAPDMAILDLNMPRLDGSEALRAMRAVNDELPILILTARTEMATRLECLDLGADDCMTKPFALAELRARVRALTRRRREAGLTLRHGVLEVNRVERTVTCGGEPVSLTQKEFALLEFLMLNRGRAVSRAVLLEQVWKMPPDAGTNVVDVYVNYLRRKLGALAGGPVVETVRGAGYAIGLAARAGRAAVKPATGAAPTDLLQ